MLSCHGKSDFKYIIVIFNYNDKISILIFMAIVLFLIKLLYSMPTPEIKNNLGSFEITDSLFICFVVSFKTNFKKFSRNRPAHKLLEIMMK